MLSFFFALMVLPGTDGRVDKTAKEEDKADEQYDTGHATVKSVSFSHTGCLTHKRFLEVGNDSNLLIVFYVQIMPDDFVMQLHRF
ncbi:Permease, cytosine/purine, uracil, thiamine, allantoin family [Escherichia coli]|nr:Permease, cytosine/purine, uracil, thiamine, allantoin family [Escherichia coli]